MFLKKRNLNQKEAVRGQCEKKVTDNRKRIGGLPGVPATGWDLPTLPQPPSSPATSCGRPWRWSVGCLPSEKESLLARTGSARRPWGRSRTARERRYHTGEERIGTTGQSWRWLSLGPLWGASGEPRWTGWWPACRWFPGSHHRRAGLPEISVCRFLLCQEIDWVLSRN